MIISTTLRFAFLSVPYTRSDIIRNQVKRLAKNHISFCDESLLLHSGYSFLANEYPREKLERYRTACLVRHPYNYLYEEFLFLKNCSLGSINRLNKSLYNRVCRFKIACPDFECFVDTFYGEMDTLYGRYNGAKMFMVEDNDSGSNILHHLLLRDHNIYGPQIHMKDYTSLICRETQQKIRHKFAADFEMLPYSDC